MPLRIQRALGIMLLVLGVVLFTILVLHRYVVPHTADFEWFHSAQFIRAVGPYECLIALTAGIWLVVRVGRKQPRSAES